MVKVNTQKPRANQTTRKAHLFKHVRRFVKLAVVPHKDNEYRPHIIRRYSLLAIMVLAFIAHGTQNLPDTNSASVLGVQANLTSQALLTATNSARTSSGVQALQYSEKLSAAAYYKARDMFEHQYWAHTGPDGSTPWKWLSKADYDYLYAGENLAKNFTTPEATATAWMGSPKHRENIVNQNYTEVGFAVMDRTLKGEPTTIIVALFAKPAPLATVAGTSASRITSAPGTSAISPIARIGIAVQSLTPLAIGTLALTLFAGMLAVVAHTYRKRLPKAIQMTWRYHHGLIKAGGMASLAVLMMYLYSGGQL